MELSGIELRYLVNEIKKKVSNGYYVSNIYGVTRDSIMLKLHHPTEQDIMLMVSSKGVWITKYKFDTMEQSEGGLLDLLKKEIVRAKVEDLQRFGSERVVLMKFIVDGTVRNLIAEFFAGGNIILCDELMKILAVLNPIEVRHRVLRVNAEYAFPPKRAIDVLELKLEDMKAMLYSDLDVARWIGRNIALAKKFIDFVVKKSGIEPNIKCSDLKEDDVNRLYRNIVDLVTDVCDGNHKPVIVMQNNIVVDASPVPLQEMQGSIEYASSYMEAVDTVLSNYLKGVGESIKASGFAGKMVELERALEEQDKAKADLVHKSKLMRNFADSLMSLTKRGVSSIGDSSVEALLAENDAKIHEERGSIVLSIKDEKVQFSKNTSMPSVASLLYGKAKELERGTRSIDNAKNKIMKELDKLKQRSEVAKKSITVKQQVSKEWFERYRWFVTTDGLLAIGGRDASSNSALIRRHLTDNDIVFHAEVHGSPFFILKNARGKEEQSINQVAQTTASFSRAWRDGLFTADAYWVHADQIRKAAPSGQYLPKGAFVIEGKRNYIRGLELRLAVGLVKIKQKLALVCGAPDSIKHNSLVYALIAPDGAEVSELAKKIKAEFIKIAGDDLADFVKSLSIDEIIRTMPTGAGKMVYSSKGEGISAIDLQQN